MTRRSNRKSAAVTAPVLTVEEQIARQVGKPFPEVWSRIRGRIVKGIADCVAVLDEFNAEVAKHSFEDAPRPEGVPAFNMRFVYRLEWSLGAIVKAETKYRVLYGLLEVLDALNAEGKLDQFTLVAAVRAEMEEVQRELLRNTRGDHSTSSISTAIERFRQEARVSMLEGSWDGLRSIELEVNFHCPQVEG